MSTRSYRFGLALGTLVREALRATKHPRTTQPCQAARPRQVPWPEAPLPPAALEQLCRVPAIVRRNGVNLNQWFEANTRENTSTNTLRRGSLNELIASVEPSTDN
ncbi:hypothetical protein C5U62_13030 [Pseudomonas protegens]|uniref:Uncharacterized protein n=1 Tax=Pseudomonas protegens TaxID=380021 RepID=A0A2T6GQE8_9PSED|nr:hypothetical protein [Pseudomonas protegens]PUA46356.1 hypothetical protein C5U62_13030 [Pseudomonas protegens]